MKKAVSLLLCSLLFAVLLCGCQPPVTVVFSTDFLGEKLTVKLFDQQDETILTQVGDLCKQYGLILSPTDPASELYAFNNSQADSVELSTELMKMLRLAFYYYELSGEIYDVTQSPLENLWGGAAKTLVLPDDEAISEALGEVGIQNINIGSSSAVPSEVTLDFGPLATGFLISEIVSLLDSAGVNAVIECGGCVAVAGELRSSRELTLESPFDSGNDKLGKIRINNICAATATVKGSSFTVNSVLYNSFYSAKTGRPAQTDLLSVTVLAPGAVQACALSEVFMRVGLYRSLDIISKCVGVSAVFCTSGLEIRVTGGFTEEFSPDFNMAYTEQVR